MVYGLKYFATAYGLSSVQWKVELLEKDYSGATTELDLEGNGLLIGYDHEDDRFHTIYSRYATIRLKANSTFNLNSLQFDDERKFQVKIYKNSVIEFVGWLVPFYPSEPFEDASINSIEIMAKDTINQLKNKEYVDAHPEVVTNQQSFKNLISQSLRELGYNLNLEIYYNKYEDNMDKTTSDCPLAQTYCNITSFLGSDNKFISYYDMLYRLLFTHDLRLFQVKGKWVVVSQIELLDGTITGRKFDYLGAYVSNVSLSSDIVFHTGGLPVLKDSIIRKDIPIQQYSTVCELGLERNLLLNGNFDSFTAGVPNNWTLHGTWDDGEITQNAGGGIIIDHDFLSRPTPIDPESPIPDSSVTPSKYIESDAFAVNTYGKFHLTAEVYADADIDAVRIRIEMIGTTSFYIDRFAKVSRSATSLYVSTGGEPVTKLVDISWNLDDPEFDVSATDMKIRIYPGVRLQAGSPTLMMVKYRKITVTGFPRFIEQGFNGRKWEFTNTGLPNSKKESEFETYFRDFSTDLAPYAVRNTLYISDESTGFVAMLWKRTSESTSKPLIETKLTDRLSVTSRYGDIFEGSVFGYIDLLNTPYLTSTSKRFLVLHCEYNLQNNSTELLLTELYSNEITIQEKIFDKYDNDRLIDISSGISSSSININEKYNQPVKSDGGTIYTPVIIDGGIDAVPLDSTDTRAVNKGHLGIGKDYADSITIGNHANDTLTEVLGRLKVTNADDFGANFNVADYTADHSVTFPNRDVVVNDWGSVFNKLTGTVNKLLKFTTDSSTYGDSQVFDDGTNVGIGTVTPAYKLDVNGTGRFSGTATFDVIPLCSVNATSANQLVNYQTVLALASGIKYDPNKVKTVALTNITLSGNQTISGYTTVNGNRVLVAGQTDAKQNGIYISDGSSWTRDTNFDVGTEIVQAIHTVESGTYAGYKYINTNTGTITVGTDNITYTEFSNLVESDPIFTASPAFGITGTQISNWDTAYSARVTGGTANYLPKYTGASALAVSQIFDNGTSVGINTTSPSSSYKLHVNGNFLATQGRFGSASLGINLLNYFGTAPRVASTADMDFFATNNYYWYTSGDLQQMRLTTTGLKIGSSGSASEKLDITGNFKYSGTLKPGGTAPTTGQFLYASSSSTNTWRSFTIADITSIGADHSFIKSNGTTTEWAVINTGELSDKDNIVMYGTYEGERGFKLYHDSSKQFDAGLFFANGDTGILGIHAYGWDGTNKTEHGIQIDEDGNVYHRKLDGNRVKFLTTDDSINTGTGTWNGGFVSNDIKIGAAIPILWGSPASVSRDVYGGKLEWGINISSQVFSSPSTGVTLESRQNLSLGASNYVYVQGNKIYLNGIEIDMTGFSTGKVLTAISSSKAQWV